VVKKMPKTKFQGGLYPSVAVSDAFNTATHIFAAMTALALRPNEPAWLGFGLVAFAGAIGTLRFGFSESLFAKANGDLAGLAAFLGLPLVGISFARMGKLVALGTFELIVFIVCGAALATAAQSLSEKVQHLTKVLVNVFLFIGPIGYVGYSTGNNMLLGSIALFAIAGIVVKPERHQYLLGMRREDWFHYMIGIASCGIAQGMA
jgi:hypothetical protein